MGSGELYLLKIRLEDLEPKQMNYLVLLDRTSIPGLPLMTISIEGVCRSASTDFHRIIQIPQKHKAPLRTTFVGNDRRREHAHFSPEDTVLWQQSSLPFWMNSVTMIKKIN